MKYPLLIIAFLATSIGFSQEKSNPDVTFTDTPMGVYLEINMSVDEGYQIFRKTEGEDYQAIGTYTPVYTASDLYKKMKSFEKIFSNFGSTKEALAEELWEMYKSNKEDLLQTPFPLLHLSIGNSFIDTSAVIGKTYQYKLVFIESEKEVETKSKMYELVQAEFEPMLFHKVMNVGKTVRLEWAVSSANNPPMVELYRRQAAGLGDFKKVNAERGIYMNEPGDSVIFIAIDTTGIIGISYDYYLVSIDYLGNQGNSSDTVRLEVGGRQNVPAVYNLSTRSDSIGIRLSWRKMNPNPSLRNILVLRSLEYDTGYVLLTTLPVSQTEFIDRDVEGGRLYYYQLIVEGASNFSIPTPRVSGKYTGKIDLPAPYDVTSRALKGGVALSWQYRDTARVRGFRVFRSTHPQEGFEFIGETIEVPKNSTLIHFVDSTVFDENTSYYYAVAAVSKTSHLSPSSTVVSGQSKSSSKLSAPTGLRKLWLNDTTVSITWVDMEQTSAEVIGYKVYKNTEELPTISEEYLSDSVEINEYVDVLYPGEVNWYWVKAMGANYETGSTSSPIRIEAIVDRPLPPEVALYQQTKSVLLVWDSPLGNSIQKYNIYRVRDKGKPTLIGSVNYSDTQIKYSDTKVKKGELYFYYVTAVDKYNVESEASTELRTRIN